MSQRGPLSPSPVATVCLACEEPPLLDAPIPLCVEHVRLTFAFYLVRAQDELSANEPQPDSIEPRERIRVPILDKDGFVYFVRFGERVKIGWSSNTDARLRNIPHDEVLAIIPGTMRHERQCHAAFAHLRITGEWFEAAPDLLAFAAEAS
jgi:hypothetical protein